MKRVWISPYTLKVTQRNQVRNGFLLKLQSREFEAGYADCFPWPGFGDPSVSQLVEGLRLGKMVPLLRQSLYFAQVDGAARAQGIKLLKDCKIHNHYLVSDLGILDRDLVEQKVELGFSTFKIKVGKNPNEELTQIKKCFGSVSDRMTLRLDFNGRFSKDCESFFDVCSKIDFIEDPFVDGRLWGKFKAKWDVSLALDQVEGSHCFDLQVIKPAKQNESEYRSNDLVFTSYMDHPVGQAFALYKAQQYGEQGRDYGLMSHHIYEPHLFSENLVNHLNSFSVLGDLGIGFDNLWNQVQWQRVV